eukprot:GEMP01020885.1.p1 GENE.GEMP01020885.1~~GEMP01020885.1.p1  ORF type:complete len:335 (+),score=61.00 GEMP01020885.1:305-1309(+)
MGTFADAWRATESIGDYYFNSYTQTGIHEDMLKDETRTGAYYNAIVDNAHLFKDKVVLDVGSGTGILSLFAAQAGAKQVIGIECADIVHVARKIAKDNGYEDTITFIHSKAEDISYFPVHSVDIIISEWMGYFLLYESMLDTVIYCRDRWLSPEGILFPDQAVIYVAGCEDADYIDKKLGFWERVWEFNMKEMQKAIMVEPMVDHIAADKINTTVAEICKLDLKTCTKQDLDFNAEFQLDVQRRDYVHAFVTWFDCTFSQCSPPIHLSTSSYDVLTHWKQTIFYFEEPHVVEAGDVLKGRITVRKSPKNPRDLDVKIGVRKNKEKWAVQLFRLR